MTWLARRQGAHRGIVLAAPAIAVMLMLAGILIWPVTDLIAAHDVGIMTGQLRVAHLQQAREAVRSQLLTLAAGAFVAGTLWFTAQTYRLARQGQVTDRYTKAIEQLGSDKLEVRIGSVFALERIAHDSPRDHSTVMEVLTAFVRERSHDPWPPDPDAPDRRTRPDIEAAMTVIGRRTRRNDRLPIDISHAELIWIWLPGADLEGADMYSTQMPRAILRGARLTGAQLIRVSLSDADLTGADLTGANLDGADLTGARLSPHAVPPPGWAADPSTGLLRRMPPP